MGGETGFADHTGGFEQRFRCQFAGLVEQCAANVAQLQGIEQQAQQARLGFADCGLGGQHGGEQQGVVAAQMLRLGSCRMYGQWLQLQLLFVGSAGQGVEQFHGILLFRLAVIAGRGSGYGWGVATELGGWQVFGAVARL